MTGDTYEWNPPRQDPVADAAWNVADVAARYFANRPAPGEPDPWADVLRAACARYVAEVDASRSGSNPDDI